jgi:hypothetical protein
MAVQTARVVVFEGMADVFAYAAGYLVTEDTVHESMVRLHGVFGPYIRTPIVTPLHVAVYTVPVVGGTP